MAAYDTMLRGISECNLPHPSKSLPLQNNGCSRLIAALKGALALSLRLLITQLRPCVEMDFCPNLWDEVYCSFSSVRREASWQWWGGILLCLIEFDRSVNCVHLTFVQFHTSLLHFAPLFWVESEPVKSDSLEQMCSLKNTLFLKSHCITWDNKKNKTKNQMIEIQITYCMQLTH